MRKHVYMNLKLYNILLYNKKLYYNKTNVIILRTRDCSEQMK